MERSKSEDDLFKLLKMELERSDESVSQVSAGSAAIQSDTSSVCSSATSSSSASTATSSSENDFVPGSPGNNSNKESDDAFSITDTLSTFIDDEEFASCVSRTNAIADSNFTSMARAAFLRTWMECDDFWLERLEMRQLKFLEKLLKLDRAYECPNK
jgi:hypothetical protein